MSQDQIIDSPCIAVCQLDDNEEFCIGCFRTPEEIEKWSDLSHEERHKILLELEKRKEFES